ncbi:MAG: alpha-amylase, partial [Akkermansiaceae bacterium]|nr:alpha-amylase [Akkermansiaceae bacterium]
HAYYENDWLNQEVFEKVAEKSYLPATRLFRELVRETDGRFRLALSFSGLALAQMADYRPDVLEAFQELVGTGAVEVLGETYYHSLASLRSPREFERQVDLHREKVGKLFGVEPRVFRNTELVYSNDLALAAEEMGFEGILGEGVSWLLRSRSPNYVCQPPNTAGIKTLLRNPGLSDDIAFRFSDRNWKEFPVTAEKFVGWIGKHPGDIVNLFMDLESLGEHQWADSGIFDFWRDFAHLTLRKGGRFVTPSEAIAEFKPRHTYDCRQPTSWADYERDLSAWLGNVMQKEAADKVSALEADVLATEDPQLIHAWSKLQTSDHLHYMSTKGGTDGEVHGYFSPYDSPYDAYIYFMNALADLQIRVQRAVTPCAAA